MKTHYLIPLLLLLSACGLPTGPEEPPVVSIPVEEISPFSTVVGQWELVEINRTDYSYPDTTIWIQESILTQDKLPSSYMKFRNGQIDTEGNVIFQCDTLKRVYPNGDPKAAYTNRYEFSILINEEGSYLKEPGDFIASYQIEDDPWIEKEPISGETFTYSQPWRIEDDQLIIPVSGKHLYMSSDCYEPPYAVRYDVGVFRKVAAVE